MANQKETILILGYSEDCLTLKRILDGDYKVVSVDNLGRLAELVSEHSPSVVICEACLHWRNAAKTIEESESKPTLIVCGREISTDLHLDVLNHNPVYDVLSGPFNPEDVSWVARAAAGRERRVFVERSVE